MFGNIPPNAGNGRNPLRWFLIGIEEDIDVYQLGGESPVVNLNQMIELPNIDEAQWYMAKNSPSHVNSSRRSLPCSSPRQTRTRLF
jgi:hypothetical protein